MIHHLGHYEYTLLGLAWLPGSTQTEEFAPPLAHSGEDTALAPLTPEVNQVLSKQNVNHREELGKLVRGCRAIAYDKGGCPTANDLWLILKGGS